MPKLTYAVEISADEGNELLELSYGDGGDTYSINAMDYRFIDIEENVEDHRWNRTDLYVFEREDGKLMGMLYDIGLTENQESGFVYNNPQLYEVERHEVTNYTYREKKEEIEL